MFVAGLQAHEGPVVDFSFHKDSHMLASCGGGYPIIWSMSEYLALCDFFADTQFAFQAKIV